MTELLHLQIRQRLEEVAERFGLTLESRGDSALLPYAELAPISVGGRTLGSEQARTWAVDAGLVCCDDGVVLPWDGSVRIEELEDRLVELLGRLLEADPDHFLVMPQLGLQIPASGELPESKAWLERLYAGGFVPREKKPLVLDLRRCQGPFMRSVDRDPLQILDGASQIASLAAGFRPGTVQAALDEGTLDRHLVSAQDVRHGEDEDSRAFARALLDAAPPGLRYVTFTNSGAEANEKALDLARRNGPGGHRVVAFEGSFHGRTLLTLFATWNPSKRERYQLPGFEAAFVPFPAARGFDDDPQVTRAWRAAWSQPGADRSQLAGDGADPLLAAEVASLTAAEHVFAKGDVLAAIVEPFQGEGGDNLATPRYYNGLRALTRAWGVPLVMDEVQAGMGLSGPVFWHSRFMMLDAEGRPDGPDLVTTAKRAQVGVVLSRWPDVRPSHAHSASMVRGHLHLEVVQSTLNLEEVATRRLERLVEAWPALVAKPRAIGDAFAFDVPTAAIANHVVNQRFYQGAMVYIAGERTLRYRLNRAMTPDDVQRLFDVIEASLRLLVQQAGGLEPLSDLVDRASACKAPAWVAPPHESMKARVPSLGELLDDPSALTADRVLRTTGELGPEVRALALRHLSLADDARGPSVVPHVRGVDAAAFEEAVGVPLVHVAADLLGTRIVQVDEAGFDRLAPEIERLEAETYEPARRDSLAMLRAVLDSEGGIVLVALDPEGLVGMAFAGPLELWWQVDGPRQDPNLFRANTLYSADITVARRARGRGIGYRLRHQQVAAALVQRRPDGRPRYAYVTGRNRVGEAAAMWATNRKLGAYQVAVYHDQYGSETGRARYYRLPLRRHDRRAFKQPPLPSPVLDLGTGILAPTGDDHPLLVRARDLGVFDEAALTKLTISNFVTRPFVRYAEYLRVVAPRGTAHLYFTSSHDEQVDKTIRVLKHQRPGGRIAVGVRGGHMGHTTAAARSLTDWGPYQNRDGYFGWPLVPHPVIDADGMLEELDELVEKHGAGALLGVFVEAVQRGTGLALDQQAWSLLCEWRDRTGVPLVLNETTTGRYRSGHGMWWLDGVSGDPDVVLWWGGGQLGHIFCNDRTFVDTPLTFISTWDGDELSATRSLWQLYACAEAPVAELSKRLDVGLEAAGFPADEIEGLGLYRVLAPDPQLAEQLWRGLERFNIRLGRGADGSLVICPPVTVSRSAIDRLCGTLAVLLREVRR